MGVSPDVSYSTYFGGTGFDAITTIAVDGGGNVYIAGYTNSSGLPHSGTVLSALNGSQCGDSVTPYPCFDAFVAKIDPTGQRVIYFAYLGGTGDDYVTGIAVDSAGAAYITGYTDSSDLPIRNAVQHAPGGGPCGSTVRPKHCFDAFVAKLNPIGSEWTFVTYLGGSADDFAQGIIVDTTHGVAVTGTTMSQDFPVHEALQADWGGGASDAFVAMLDPNGVRLLSSTFLGGIGDDFGTGIATDSQGAIYLAGYTNSADLPSTGGPQEAYSGGTCGAITSTYACFDAYAAKLSPDWKAIDYLTYLGGTGGDYAYGIAVDTSGSATIAGMTTSRDFPTTFGAFQMSGGGNNTDAFVARLDPTGTLLAYSTYLGGLGVESANAITVHTDGRAVVAGYSYGLSIPDTFRLGSGGFHDFFLAVLASDGSALDISASLGGTDQEKARAVAIDKLGNAYVAGETFSADYPISNALQVDYAGGAFEGAVTKLALGGKPYLHASPVHVDFGEQRVASASEPRAVMLANIGAGVLTFEGFDVTGNFAISAHNCVSLSPGSSCEVFLKFLPSTTGVRTGSLTVRNNGSGGASRIDLSGVGVAAEIRLSVTSVVFDSQLVGTESRSQEVTLSNAGTAPFDLSGIAVSGAFAEKNNCTAIIPVDGHCSIWITFAPSSTGEHLGGLTVTNGVPEEARRASLSGIGADFLLAALPAEAALRAGESAIYTVRISSLSGFSGDLSLTCTGAPRAAVCSISPTTASLKASSLAEVKVTVTTAAAAAALALPDAPNGSVRLGLAFWMVITLIFSNWHRKIPSRQRATLRNAWVLPVVLVSTILITACGGSGGLSNSPSYSSGTPAGIYTLRVDATIDGVTRGTNFALVVR